MGTVLLSSLVDQARTETMDTGDPIRHTDGDYLLYANAGLRQMAIFKPDVSVVNTAVVLVGGTKQALAPAATVFIKLVRNMGTDGSAPGPAIRFRKDMERFSIHNPYWHMADPASQVKFYFFDQRDPKVFYVYPPQPEQGCGYVEQVYGVAPAAIAEISDPISVDDIYANVLLDYLLFRLFKTDSTINPYATAKATAHWNLFATALGRQDLTEKQNSPKEGKSNAG